MSPEWTHLNYYLTSNAPPLPEVAGHQMARPERFELPTNWFEASYSIQLSYGRVKE